MYYQNLCIGGPQGGCCGSALEDPSYLKYRIFPEDGTEFTRFAVYEYGHSETKYGITRRYYNYKKSEAADKVQSFLEQNQKSFSD